MSICWKALLPGTITSILWAAPTLCGGVPARFKTLSSPKTTACFCGLDFGESGLSTGWNSLSFFSVLIELG